ncbi:MAG: hypothetical protein V4676_09115 [Bacteroidota bacterium]
MKNSPQTVAVSLPDKTEITVTYFCTDEQLAHRALTNLHIEFTNKQNQQLVALKESIRTKAANDDETLKSVVEEIVAEYHNAH